MAKKRINLPYDRASDGPRVPVFVAARRSAAAIHGSTSSWPPGNCRRTVSAPARECR